MSTGRGQKDIEQFVVVFHRLEDPTRWEESTLFAAMMLLGVRVIDGAIPGNVLVEGREEDVAAMVSYSKEWSYTRVTKLGPTAP